MELNEHMSSERELINKRDQKSDWRKEGCKRLKNLPMVVSILRYVDVMPDSDQVDQMVKNKKKDKKKRKKKSPSLSLMMKNRKNFKDAAAAPRAWKHVVRNLK